MDMCKLNPLDREVAELNERVADARQKIALLAENREVIGQMLSTCRVSTVSTVCGNVTLWLERGDLPKARTILGRLKLRSKLATGPDQLAVFVDTQHPAVQLAYYRPGPGPKDRCKIVTEERTQTHRHFSLACPS